MFFGRTIGGIPVPAVDAYAALEMVFRATSYTPKSRWAYNFRGIGGTVCTCSEYGRCSLHSNGIAVDNDPRLNPYVGGEFDWDKTAFTRVQIDAVYAILNTYGERMWDWGGYWTRHDYMHFELGVAPDRCEVDWTTVAGFDGVQEDEGMIYSKTQNRKHPNVKLYQEALLGWDASSLSNWGADGDYGNETTAAVSAFQTDLRLASTGTLDLDSQHFLAPFHPKSGGGSGAQGPPGPKGDSGDPGPKGDQGSRGAKPSSLTVTGWE